MPVRGDVCIFVIKVMCVCRSYTRRGRKGSECGENTTHRGRLQLEGPLETSRCQNHFFTSMLSVNVWVI